MSAIGFNEALDVIVDCRDGKIDRPHIQSTLRLGDAEILRKLGEEASEVAMACKDHKYGDGSTEDVEDEIADILYYLLLIMAHHQVTSDIVFRMMWDKREWSTQTGELQDAFQRICDCRDGTVKDSHIRKTLRKGDDKILRKIGEESAEVIMACKDWALKAGPKEHVEEEVGDVFYYVLIAMAHHDIATDRVFDTMWRKHLYEAPKVEEVTKAEVAAAPEYPDRPLALNSAYYVERPPIESDCYREVLRPGSLVRIKGPKSIGKTSLLNRVLSHASDQGLSTVRLNLEQVEGGIVSSLDRFLRWMSAKTTQQLQLESKIDEHWDEELLGSMESCTAYFQDYIFDQLEEPLVLGLDAVDRLFDAPETARDFFALMRVWHEEANNLEIWQRLRLVVVHSTEVYIPLKLNQSPFNVGMPVRLPDFTVDQILELAQRYRLDWTPAQAGTLLALVGGHPHLVHSAIYHLQDGRMTLDELLKSAATQTGIYTGYLRGHYQRLQDHPDLGAAFKNVIEADAGVQLEPVAAYKLESLGLVQIDGDAVKPSCELYREYFRSQL